MNKGEKPQKIFDDIIAKIQEFSNQGLNNTNEKNLLESMKRLYNDSVNAIINKKDNLKMLEKTILKLDLNYYNVIRIDVNFKFFFAVVV